jgi:hypothetical protein
LSTAKENTAGEPFLFDSGGGDDNTLLDILWIVIINKNHEEKFWLILKSVWNR